MKKSILLFLLTFISFQLSQAQITKEDYKSVIPYLQDEDWKAAYKMTSKMLEKADADTSEYKQMVAYFNIYAAVGLTSEKKMDRKKLAEVVGKYKDQPIFLAGHLASPNQKNTLNKTFLSKRDGATNGFTIVTNRKMKVLIMEDINFKKPFDPAPYVGSFVRCGGILKDFKISEGMDVNDWVINLTVSDAFIRRTK